MTPEDKLNALFAADRPPARDYGFEARVAQRVALRRAWMTVLGVAPWVLAASLALWAARPMIEPAAREISLWMPVVAVAAICVASLMAVGRRLIWRPLRL